MKRWLGRAAFVAGSVLAAWVLCELVLVLFLHHPRWARALGHAFHSHLRGLYMRSLQPPQFRADCARWDAELFYTLEPGRCRFDTPEFSTEIAVNSLGVRDGEGALRAPEIVVLGDSYTMGWGVAAGERFSDLLARETGLRVLNAGISSYGTVRELRLLDRIDWSQLKYVIIQYDANDFHENAVFADRGNVLRVHDRATWEDVVHGETASHRYHWGRYTVDLLQHAFLAHADSGIGELTNEPRTREPEVFLNALGHAGKRPLPNVPLILWQSREDLAFLDAVERNRGALPLTVARFHLGDDHYFIYDNHLDARGHAAVAHGLARLIKEAAAPPPAR